MADQTGKCVSVRKLIIAQVVDPCLRQANFVKIRGTHIVIKFKLLGPETSNIECKVVSVLN
jgi:hypothetical protein